MTKKTDLIRVDRRFAEALRKASEASGESMIDITSQIPITKTKKKRANDPFGLTVI